MIGMVVGTENNDPVLVIIGLLVFSLALYAAYQTDYDNGITTDSPGYTGNTVQVYIDITTPAPTLTLSLDGFGQNCTYLNQSDTSAGFVCLPRSAQGAGP